MQKVLVITYTNTPRWLEDGLIKNFGTIWLAFADFTANETACYQSSSETLHLSHLHLPRSAISCHACNTYLYIYTHIYVYTMSCNILQPDSMWT